MKQNGIEQIIPGSGGHGIAGKYCAESVKQACNDWERGKTRQAPKTWTFCAWDAITRRADQIRCLVILPH